MATHGMTIFNTTCAAYQEVLTVDTSESFLKQVLSPDGLKE